MINRMLLRTVLAGFAAVLLVPAAAAEMPSREPAPAADFSGQFCKDFRVGVHVVQNKEFFTVFSSGAALITGVLKVEVTNLSTGKTLALNISGPGTFSPDGSTAAAHGTWMLFGEAGQMPGPDPGMLLVTGSTSLVFGPAGLTSISTRGRTEDLCAALAA
ncbi:MAG TPA: hypothetical protein VFP31_00560 [Gaiellaceae bacterium]|nr:hypothetical protein [Gaiellaceae bacterium]